MKKIKNYLKKYWLYLVAFLIPFLIMVTVYLSQGIYWNSDTSPLLGDGFHQYVIFDTTLRNILHGNDSLFYTFTSGLGLNFYALTSYYLGSFLSPFVYFFNLENMPDAVYLFTLIKFGLIGLTATISLKGIFKKIPTLLILMLSTCYSLMSFAISQIEIKTWLDVFILAPLILYGLHRLIIGQDKILYFTSLTILFIQNYYFGYMMALFLVFWFLVQAFWDFKNRIKTFLDFTVVSILSGVTSLIMILPTFLDLMTHGEKLTSVDKIFTEKTWYLDIFAKNFIGSFDTTKYGSIPMVYVGIIPLLLAILFFTLKSIKFHVKLSYFLLILLFIASFSLERLDLFWQGMHAPNMFLHRYSWLFSLLIIFIAAETLQRLKQIKFKNIIIAFTFLSIGFSLVFIFRKHYDFLGPVNFILTLEFLLAYLLIFGTFAQSYISKKIFLVSILTFVSFEVSLNAFYQVDGIAKEWVFASRSSYAKHLKTIDKLVNYAKKENKEFFRTESLDPQTGNDSMKYNYNGISQFSSVRNTMTSSTLDKLGFKSSGTNLNLRYQNNSILMDAIFSVAYNIAETNPKKYGFTPIKTESNLSLYQNKNSTSLAFLTNEVYKDVKFNNLTLDNQSKFLNNLSGLNYNYFQRIEPISAHNILKNNKTFTVNVDKDSKESFASMTYTVNIPANSQVYVSLPNINFSNDDQKVVEVSIGKEKRRFTTNNVFTFFNIGYFKEEQIVTIRFTFPDNSQVSFDKPEFYKVNTKHFQEAMDKIHSQNVTVTTQNSQITVNYEAKQDSSLFLTLPYDKGWSATQDGQPISIHKAQEGFMKVDVKKGRGKVILKFFPNGLKEGILCFILGIIIFIIHQHKTKYRIKK